MVDVRIINEDDPRFGAYKNTTPATILSEAGIEVPGEVKSYKTSGTFTQLAMGLHYRLVKKTAADAALIAVCRLAAELKAHVEWHEGQSKLDNEWINGLKAQLATVTRERDFIGEKYRLSAWCVAEGWGLTEYEDATGEDWPESEDSFLSAALTAYEETGERLPILAARYRAQKEAGDGH